MKFNINREDLIPGLQIVNGVIERRHTLPILSNLLFLVNKTGVTLTGTDMEVELVYHIEHNFEGSIEFTIPSRKLLDICRALPEGSILDFQIEKDQVILKSGKSKFTLATLPAKEYPSVEINEAQIKLEITQNDLKSLVDDTMFAMAQQDVRYYLNGLLLEVCDNKIRAVATDGHRLALKELDKKTEIKETSQVIIPRKGVLEISRLLSNVDENVNLEITKNHIRIVLKDIEFTSKLIDGKFPDYERVIPEISPTPLVAGKEALKQSLTRASILSNEKYKGVRIILNKDSLKALAHNPEQEEAEEELEVQYTGNEMEIGFNVTYLLDAINAIKTDKVVITTNNPDSSCLILPEDKKDCKYVVMPMRL